MKIIYQGSIGRLDFTLAQGDIFEAKVESIVNSEQSNFILSTNPDTISGQIKKRFGQTVQPELYSQTTKDVFQAGTVLGTSGGDAFKRIYHAGFHEPEDRSSESKYSTGAQRLENIGSCLDQVLQMAATDGVGSVAFPLIGCGVYKLDVRMLLQQFLHALEQFNRRWTGEKSIHVWLIIKDEVQMNSVLNYMIGQLIGHREQMVAIAVQRTGFPILDRFASRNLGQRADVNWVKWQLCRYAEIALAIMCYGLSRATDPASTPATLFTKKREATFGSVRVHAFELSTGYSDKCRREWGSDFFVSVLRNGASSKALIALNEERNKLSHGEKSLPVDEIKKMMLESLQLKDWEKIHQTDGELRLEEWNPWVVASPSATGAAGLFNRLFKDEIRYLVPETGEVFGVPRKATTLG